MSVRLRLIQLVLAAAIPGVLLAGFIGWLSYSQQRDDTARQLATTARAIALSIDRQLGQALALAEGLATSPFLESDDVAGFARQAAAVTDMPHRWVALVSADRPEGPLVNTALPAGAPPNTFIDGRAWLKRVAETGTPTVLDIASAPVASGWAVTVQHPVTRDGRIVYVVAVRLNADVMQHTLETQRLPAGWIATLLDRTGKIVARTVTPEQMRGKPASPTLMALLERRDEGVETTHTLEGVPVFTAVTRAPVSGWSIGLGVPETELSAVLVQSSLLALAGGLGLTAIMVALALFLARRIAGPIRRLEKAAIELGQERLTTVPALPLREANAVAIALTNAAAELRRRAEDRDRASTSLRELAASLEQRVAARTAELATTNAQLKSEIAERQRAEQALVHAQKMEAVGQLSGGIAHDFNNLLTAVLGNLELLQARLPNQLRAYVTRARTAAERGARLTAQLLSFSSRQMLRVRPTDINRLVSTTSDMLHRTLGSDITVTTKLAPTLWPASADENQLGLCVLNLVLNARDAMPGGGTIVLSTANTTLMPDTDGPKPGDYACITVSDEGQGMTDEVRKRAMEPFFTTKDVGKGTGLGLSTVYGTMRQLGGDVRIVSAPGAGTSVSLYLPRATPAAEDASPTVLIAPVMPRNGHLLVVDDDPDVRTVMAALLRDDGYHVIEATSGAEALSVLDSGAAVDALLADYAMPEMSGLQLLRQARSRRPDLPAAIITGYASVSMENESDVAVLRKPISRETLIQTAASLVASAAADGLWKLERR
jgi:signal transduction histidine kinase